MYSKTFLLIGIFLIMFSCEKQPHYEHLTDYPVYEGSDLGFTYTESATHFRLWSPAAKEVRLKIYSSGNGDNLEATYAMKRAEKGTWTFSVSGNLKGKYYTYQVNQEGQWMQEKPDLYAVAVGVNGRRSMIVDLDETDPEGWDLDKRPALNNYTDIIIYELHIRDMTIHPSSGSGRPGKYAGLIETGTRSPQGLTTGLDHIKELGVTHVHLLPTFDHRSIDETRLNEPQYNWGYDPLNYNVPEGSFSSDPYDGAVRIKEFKEMVQAFHQNGIRVILDVVYNHTGETEDSNFNQLVPRYYYRQNEEGGFSDASACGNETASERAMMRKYIVESVQYWVKEYHLDGFRFDLMGIHDIETMNAVSEAVRAIDPSLFVYGEGWTAGASPLPQDQQAIKANTYKLNHVAAFSDDLRDGLKGSVFEHEEGGFVSQRAGLKESIKFGIVASTQHPQIDYSQVNYSKAPWAAEPGQTISYVSCHDNHTLWDKLEISNPTASEEERIKMHKLAETIVLTSQGVPFLHAGMEFLRTKQGVENSYNSPDSINQLDWRRKEKYKEVFEYYKQLIALRKNHPAFRMTSTAQIQAHLEFLPYEGENFLAYQLKNNANGDNWHTIVVLLNGSGLNKTIELPDGEWTLVADGNQVNEQGLKSSSRVMTIPASTAFILKKD
ncbi:type I pullulanase [Roseivirga sp. UBA838]|uniref:type I pullulanase n=1 Tax=Roseivirga sp. UBA838 TaxID=1947393 RepID=UPI00257E8AF7|nr:type I pullulanase [Roseivirga sp. UBA838]|tara:strand:+ start:11757 stop:13748 length:1992 start_codon:yes stop_codon:yes gene_type:complete